MSYDALNKIGIQDVKMSESGMSLVADLTAAYESNVGVSKFLRRFEFKAPGEFLIDDDIQTDRPEVITSYLHSDSSIMQKSDGFEFESGSKPTLLAEILEPELYDITIGPNFLTAPGPPGSVDKGQREQRGIRLAITTKQPTRETRFKIRLRIRQ